MELLPSVVTALIILEILSTQEVFIARLPWDNLDDLSIFVTVLFCVDINKGLW